MSKHRLHAALRVDTPALDKSSIPWHDHRRGRLHPAPDGWGQLESKSTESELIDRIYECGFVPELWPEVLKQTSKISDSAGATLFITNPDVTAWTASKNSKPIAERFVADGWYWRGQLMSRIHESRHQGFLRDVDLCSEAELDEEPIYRDNWRKLGLWWGAATAFELPTGEAISIVLSRTAAQGPASAEAIQRLDMLRPHFARTALMAARLHLARAEAASQTLAALGLAALVLDDSGKVLAANALIEGLENLVDWRAADRVTLKDRCADELMGEALARVTLNDNGGVRSFPVRDPVTDALMVGHVVPIRFSARDIFARSAAVFILMPVAAPNAPPVDLVMSLFDLTPAEARVARGLAAGKTVDDLAGDNGVSPNTVRVQVRGVLEKTGCQRQTDVVALLGGISAVRGPDDQRS
ncbi:MAG: helix-turn-helix transcriptional regulator [Bradyrhizobium sp.]|nr:helix-turn-helix transcriptional regulator [Bradyrhizobium sp.]